MFFRFCASIHKADGRLTARSREALKLRDSGLNFSKRYEILEPYSHYNIQSRGLETSRDLAVKRVAA